MNSLTSITLDLQAPNIAVVTAGKQNDLMSRKIACQLRDGDSAFTPPGDAAAMIRYAKPDGTVGFYDVLEDETTPAWSVSGSVITITLCEQMLTVPGNVWVEINFYTSTEKLTTFYFLLEVQASVLSDGTIISSEYYNVLSAQIQALLGATTNPPKIDPITKNWLLWDENAGVYVDSGYSSVGTTGPAPDLQNTTYEYANSASGTTVPSSWSSTRPAPEQGKYSWTKTTLTFDTGTTTYYTAAYQGIDGTGSPGAATPLADSGAGVVGTANAYSRQDHQHPLNVPSSGTPEADGTATSGDAVTYARSNHVHPLNVPTSGTPADLGAADNGSSEYYARADHVHAFPYFMVKVWENTSPTSSFAAQTVSVDLTNYGAILCVFSNGQETDGTTVSTIVIKGTVGMLLAPHESGSGGNFYRSCSPTNNGVAFGDGKKGGSGTVNTDNIPLAIYGIKGVLLS